VDEAAETAHDHLRPHGPRETSVLAVAFALLAGMILEKALDDGQALAPAVPSCHGQRDRTSAADD
jgi:hypothetical protein